MKNATLIRGVIYVTNPANPDVNITYPVSRLFRGKLRDETQAKMIGSTFRSKVQAERATNVKARVTSVETVRYSEDESTPGASRFLSEDLPHFGGFLEAVHKVTPVKVTATIRFEEGDLHDYIRQFKLA